MEQCDDEDILLHSPCIPPPLQGEGEVSLKLQAAVMGEICLLIKLIKRISDYQLTCSPPPKAETAQQ